MRASISPDAASFVPRKRRAITTSCDAIVPPSARIPITVLRPVPIVQHHAWSTTPKRAQSASSPPQPSPPPPSPTNADARTASSPSLSPPQSPPSPPLSSCAQLDAQFSITNPAQIRDALVALNARMVIISDVTQALSFAQHSEDRALEAALEAARIYTLRAAHYPERYHRSLTQSNIAIVRLHTSENPRADMSAAPSQDAIKYVNARIPPGQFEMWTSLIVMMMTGKRPAVWSIAICAAPANRSALFDTIRATYPLVRINAYDIALDEKVARSPRAARLPSPISPPYAPLSPPAPAASALSLASVPREAIRALLGEILRYEILYLFTFAIQGRTTPEQFVHDWRIPPEPVLSGSARTEYVMSAMFLFLESLGTPRASFPFNADIFTPQLCAIFRKTRANFPFAPTSYAPLTPFERAEIHEHIQFMRGASMQQ